jgi:hypothetical protein
MDQAFETAPKLLWPMTVPDLVISVIDKDTPVLYDQLQVLIMLGSLLNSTSVVDCFKDFQLSRMAHLVDRIK